jgi:hypothetical protein
MKRDPAWLPQLLLKFVRVALILYRLKVHTLLFSTWLKILNLHASLNSSPKQYLASHHIASYFILSFATFWRHERLNIQENNQQTQIRRSKKQHLILSLEVCSMLYSHALALDPFDNILALLAVLLTSVELSRDYNEAVKLFKRINVCVDI